MAGGQGKQGQRDQSGVFIISAVSNGGVLRVTGGGRNERCG